MGATSSFPGIWHFSFHIYFFSLFLASTKLEKFSFISYNSFLADSEAAFPTSTLLAFQEGRWGERSRRGGQNTCLGFIVRWGQDASRLLGTGKHSPIACKQFLTFVALWRERWEEFSWDFCPWKAVCCNYIILPMLFGRYTSSWQPSFSASVLVKYFMTEISGLSDVVPSIFLLLWTDFSEKG